MATYRLLAPIPLACCLWVVLSSQPAFGFTGFGNEVDRYIRMAAERYQVSEVMLRGLVKMEDGWYGKVSPTGPMGVGQFTAKTWNWLAETERGKQLGMIPVTGYNRGTAYDPRRNKYINTLATALLARWHIEQFPSKGIPITDENLYMAHNIGLDGFHRALQGRATRDDIVNMRRNGMKPWMAVRDFLSYQKSRYTQHKIAANYQYNGTNAQPHRSTPIAVTPTTPVPVPNNPNWVRIILPKVVQYSQPQSSSRVSGEDIAMSKQNQDKSLTWIEPSEKRIVWVAAKN